MAVIRLNVTTNFQDASKDIKDLGTTTEAQRKVIEKYTAEFKSDSINQFIDKQNRASAAIKATRGPTEALTSEHRAYQRQIETLIRRGLDPESEQIQELKNRYVQLQREIEDVNAAEQKHEKTSALTAASLLYIGQQAINAGKQVIQFSKELIDAAGVQEEAEARLRQTIISTGGAAELSASQLTDMASALQGVTKYGDEAIIGAESLLLTFKEVGSDVFPRALESILDVSEAMGQDLKSSTVQLGKALNDPVGGISALTRVGIQFTDVQKQMIKDFVESGDVASAQGVILEELESQFGGVAKAAADTASGSFVQLENATGDLREAYGALLSDGVQPINNALTEMVGNWAKALSAQKEAIAFTKELKGGYIEEGRSLEELQEILAGLEKQRGQAGRGAYLKDDIEAVKALITAYGTEDAWLTKLKNSNDVLSRSEEVQAQNALEASQKAAEAEMERNKWTLKRIEIENKLKEDLNSINDSQKLNNQLGLEYNATQEKSKAVLSALNELRKEGFTVEGAGIQGIIDRYGELLIVTEEKETELTELKASLLSERLQVLNDLEAQAQIDNMSSFQDFLNARMAQEQVTGENRIAFLISEESRIARLGKLYGSERIALNKQIESMITEEKKKQKDARIALMRAEVSAVAELFGAMSGLIATFAGANREAAIAAKALAHAQAGINSFLAFTQTLADPTLPWWAKAAKAAAILASGLTAQANIAKTPIPTAQTGTGSMGITVPQVTGTSRQDNVAVMAQPGETINVSPRGGGGSGGQIVNANFYMNDEVLATATNRLIESGEIIIRPDNIQGGQTA